VPAEVTRPRFGELRRQDGSTVPLVFHPTSDPLVFLGLHADTEEPVRLGPGDRARIDVLGPGQAVTFETPFRR
jgi:hypothetical protein